MTENVRDYLITSYHIPKDKRFDFSTTTGICNVGSKIYLLGLNHFAYINVRAKVYLANLNSTDKSSSILHLKNSPHFSISVSPYFESDNKYLSEILGDGKAANYREFLLNESKNNIITLDNFILESKSLFLNLLDDTFSKDYFLIDTPNENHQVFITKEKLSFMIQLFDECFNKVLDLVCPIKNAKFLPYTLEPHEKILLDGIVNEINLSKMKSDLEYSLPSKELPSGIIKI